MFEGIDKKSTLVDNMKSTLVDNMKILIGTQTKLSKSKYDALIKSKKTNKRKNILQKKNCYHSTLLGSAGIRYM